MRDIRRLTMQKREQRPVFQEHRRLYDLHIRGDVASDRLEERQEERAQFGGCLAIA